VVGHHAALSRFEGAGSGAAEGVSADRAGLGLARGFGGAAASGAGGTRLLRFCLAVAVSDEPTVA
jgi:hypothetical protein